METCQLNKKHHKTWVCKLKILKIALFLRLVVILMTMLGEANQKTLFETAINPYQCSMIGQER